ncbi:uncharacterized protein [Anabrus simplex]|uniref:uncharacterized protein n=1 Tax=Anabrus simplex TaxID=316456 RepID=UPI0034DD9D0F
MTSIKPFFFSALILHLVLGSPVTLENDVKALRYDVKFSLLEDKTSFTGNEVVSVKAIKETSVLRLKYSNVEISTVTVYDPRKTKDELVTSYERKDDNSFHVNLISPLQKDTVYIVRIEFSGTFETDMTFERLFEQKGNGNVFPCFENSDSQTVYQMSVILSQDGENEIQPLVVNQDFDVVEEEIEGYTGEDPKTDPPSSDDDSAASFSMISSSLLSIMAICVISLR